MKKNIVASILCLLLAVSAVSFAETPIAEAVFDDFTLTIDRINYTGGSLSISMTAAFPSEEMARQYLYFSPQGDLAPDALDDQYRSFARSIAENRGGNPTLPDRFMLLMTAFKTESGKTFFPDGSFDIWEFGSFSEPEQQADGAWSTEVALTADGFTTDEDTLVIELYVFDPQDDAPYTGEVQHTLEVAIPKA